MSPGALVFTAVGLLGLAAGFVVSRTGWRVVVHVVAVSALIYGVFRAGVASYEDDPCAVAGSGSCGWALLQGVWWAAIAVVVGLGVVAVAELRRMRSG